jgi:hypothetical protein
MAGPGSQQGELWRRIVQIGKEVTPGTAVVATRKLYPRDPNPPGPGQENRMYKFATGTRDNQRASTRGAVAPAGQLVFPISSDELLEMYDLAIAGGVTPATGVATFKPGNLGDTASIEWYDGAHAFVEGGVQVASIRWAGNVAAGSEHLVTCNLFGTSWARMASDNVTGTGSTGLTDRVPTFHEGWESTIFIDAGGATPGTTPFPHALVAWDITYDNRPERKYLGDNVRNAARVVVDDLQLSGTIDLEAGPPTGGGSVVGEYLNYETPIERVVRLQFGQTGGSYTTLDIPGIWRVADLGQTDRKTRIYRMTLDYLYDPTLAYGFQLQAHTGRTTLF